MQTLSGYANIGEAKLYYETAGSGQPLVMIHAGIADSRQWNSEFAAFAEQYRVVRYDMRGYGKSEPVAGEFTALDDLMAILDTLKIHEPMVLMGCSRGGQLAMNFAITQPSRVQALIMVGSGPAGLDLDVPENPKFAEVEKADEAGQLERVNELELQIWVDGTGRTPEQVNPAMRKLAHDMNWLALTHEAKHLGKRLPDLPAPAAERLYALNLPVLAVVGEYDEPYSIAAADYMVEHMPSTRKAVIKDAAHLPNMDHPQEFQCIVREFLDGLR